MKNLKKLIALCVATLILGMAVSVSSCAETPQTPPASESMSSSEHSFKTEYSFNATHHWYDCENCDEKKNYGEHTGGTATSTTKAICEICYQEYRYFSGPIMSEAPEGTVYSLGDQIYDFSITTCDGSTFTLSEVLKKKQLVMLNFWATYCGPCKIEFPAMNSAYSEYKDNE